jgi:hypothetical protein
MLDKTFYDAAAKQLDSKIYTHSLALVACMGGLYEYFSENNLLLGDEPKKDDWLLAGLIHDIDYSGEYKETHPQKTREVLAKYNLEISDTVEKIVKSHAPELTGVNPQTKAEWSIFCADSLTGLIMAVAYVYPSKKLADVKTSSVLKRFLKEPKFAAGTRRDEVVLCEKPEGLNLPLEKFIEICLTSMQKVAADLGI